MRGKRECSKYSLLRRVERCRWRWQTVAISRAIKEPAVNYAGQCLWANYYIFIGLSFDAARIFSVGSASRGRPTNYLSRLDVNELLNSLFA